MSLTWLIVVYVVVGIVCAALSFDRADERGAPAALAALVTLFIWPLWAPFALLDEDNDEI